MIIPIMLVYLAKYIHLYEFHWNLSLIVFIEVFKNFLLLLGTVYIVNTVYSIPNNTMKTYRKVEKNYNKNNEK